MKKKFIIPLLMASALCSPVSSFSLKNENEYSHYDIVLGQSIKQNFNQERFLSTLKTNALKADGQANLTDKKENPISFPVTNKSLSKNPITQSLNTISPHQTKNFVGASMGEIDISTFSKPNPTPDLKLDSPSNRPLQPPKQATVAPPSPQLRDIDTSTASPSTPNRIRSVEDRLSLRARTILQKSSPDVEEQSNNPTTSPQRKMLKPNLPEEEASPSTLKTPTRASAPKAIQEEIREILPFEQADLAEVMPAAPVGKAPQEARVLQGIELGEDFVLPEPAREGENLVPPPLPARDPQLAPPVGGQQGGANPPPAIPAPPPPPGGGIPAATVVAPEVPAQAEPAAQREEPREGENLVPPPLPARDPQLAPPGGGQQGGANPPPVIPAPPLPPGGGQQGGGNPPPVIPAPPPPPGGGIPAANVVAPEVPAQAEPAAQREEPKEEGAGGALLRLFSNTMDRFTKKEQPKEEQPLAQAGKLAEKEEEDDWYEDGEDPRSSPAVRSLHRPDDGEPQQEKTQSQPKRTFSRLNINKNSAGDLWAQIRGAREKAQETDVDEARVQAVLRASEERREEREREKEVELAGQQSHTKTQKQIIEEGEIQRNTRAAFVGTMTERRKIIAGGDGNDDWDDWE